MLVARQPIYDRKLKVAAYELLVRAEGDVPDDAATSQVLLGAFTEIGLRELVGDHPAYLKVAPSFLTEGYPLPLRTDQLVSSC